jgi:5-methylcytosine-specific restriction endonuclease McrA
MPNAALRPCTYAGCTNLVKHGRCPDHRQAEPDYHKPEHQRLYNTAQWERMRRMQLACQPWCEDCIEQGLFTPACDVDHVEPHRGDPVKFYTGKLRSLCHSCHSRKTQQELHGVGAEKVFNRGAASGRGLPHEKISQCGESG